MSVIAESHEVKQAEEILEFAENLRPHVTQLARSTEHIKVKVYKRTYRRTPYIDLVKGIRITRYGLVLQRKKHGPFEVIWIDELLEFDLVALVDIRRSLLELFKLDLNPSE